MFPLPKSLHQVNRFIQQLSEPAQLLQSQTMPAQLLQLQNNAQRFLLTLVLENTSLTT
jgi:hypothetical protein